MQTTDLSSLIQLMNTPGGDSLIPMLSNRERQVNDASAADLQSTLTRTAIAKNEDTRNAEMHPLSMESKRLGNRSTELKNTDSELDLDVRKALGTDFEVDQKREAEKAKQADYFKKSSADFAKVAAFLEPGPDDGEAVPGETRARAREILKKSGMDYLIPKLESIKDEKQIAPTFKGMADAINKYSRQAYTEEIKQGGADRRNERSTLSRERIAEIQAAAKLKVAQVAAAAKRSGAGGGAGKPPYLDQLAATYLKQAGEAQDEETKVYYTAMAEGAMELKRRGTASSTAEAATLVPKPGGGSTIGQAPKNPPPSTGVPVPPRPAGLPASQNPTAPTVANQKNLGGTKEAPAQVKSQADYDKLPKGSVYVHPQTGKLMQKN